ncbi:MAG: methylmalonyl Co-A mutase-associated GTPase MeaB [Acidimicrobiales bacterium]
MSVAAELVDGIRAGDRRALARGITLVESTRPDHREQAIDLLDAVLDPTRRTIRVGITGTPGVGKSTFIEALGLHVVGEGHRLAVLAVDPTSRRSGGSILGDKTRMVDLVRHERAFIRPSPAGTTLGGVARRTREALLLCEAAGFDVVFVETVGVGQSETAVSELVDLFLLLVAPGGGDDLQGIKRGVMELADLLVVNKADGDLMAAANRAAADHRNALSLMRPHWEGTPAEVMLASSLQGSGVAEVWTAVQQMHRGRTERGIIDAVRRDQATAALWSDVHDQLVDGLRSDPDSSGEVSRIEAQVAAGERSASSGASQIIDTLTARRGG